MIEYKNGIFHLRTKAYSCLLRVNDYGLLEQLHFGPPVETGDAEAFCLRPGIGWGSSVLLKEKDTASCMDTMALAYSGSGRGDYRESPLDLGASTDFRCHSHHIYHATVPMEGPLPQAKGEGWTLEVVMTQPGWRLHLYFTAFPTALTRRVKIVNTSQEEQKLHKCMSFLMDLPGTFQVTTFSGGWIAEMRKETAPVGKTRLVNESTTGFSSHRHNPGFLLSSQDATEDHGLVYGFNLIYSGNHYGSVQQSHQGLTRVMQGISPDHFTKALSPGESFETPEAVLCVSEAGFSGLSEAMHTFVTDHIIPVYWRNRPRPVLYNDWEGCMFDFNTRKLLSLARQAKSLGCELFVLDDGWFGKRNDDTAGLGDYNVNRKKLPTGLRGLGNRVRSMGMEFGLWVEPESVNTDSDLYRAHPDWALTDAFEPVKGRNQLLLDLTKQEVQDYIVENVTSVLDSAPISYIKWDMNRHSVALGAKAHDYILGLYRVMDRIFTPRPHILLENCASGGNRFDLGMLCYGPQIWCSDNTDPMERLNIQENLSYLYPQSTFGAHVSAAPHAQTLRNTPLVTRGNVSFFGCLGYELDLAHLLPIEKKQIRRQIALYKKYREVFQFGLFRRIKNGWQVTKGAVSLAAVFRGFMQTAPGYQYLKLKDLDKTLHYRFTSVGARLRVGQFGNLVKHVVPVNLNPHGVIMRTVDRHITLPDGHQELTLSGAALHQGIPLLPLFRGTGYDENQRTLLDFGSELFIIEEERAHEES